MNKKIGFIGCGNMGEAMLNGIIDSFDNSDKIYVFEKNEERQNKKDDKRFGFFIATMVKLTQ